MWAEGEIAGVQAIGARRFAEQRTVRTGSWLGRSFHGRGIGPEMRAAVLGLAFSGMGAATAATGALKANPASARVSQKLSYVELGDQQVTV